MKRKSSEADKAARAFSEASIPLVALAIFSARISMSGSPIPVRGIAFNTILSLTTKIVGVALGFFSLGITTRLLGQGGFGVYSTVLAYASIVSFLGDFGLYSLMVREISRARDRESESEVASKIFTIRLFALLGFFALGILLTPLFPHKGTLPVLALLLASLQYFSLSVSQVLVGIFQKYLAIGFVAFAELVGRAATLGVLIIAISYAGAASNSTRIALALGAFALGSFIIAVVSVIGARRLILLHFSIDFGAWKHLLVETLPMGIVVVVTALYFRLDTILLAFLRSEAEVGIYNGAYRILEVLAFFPAAFVGLLMPGLSRYALIDGDRFTKIFRGGLEALLVVTFPISAGLFFESDRIVSFIAGQAFLPSGSALSILSGAIFMIFFGSLFSNALIAKKRQWELAVIYITAMVVNIVTNVLVIPRWGYIGAAWTTLLTEGLATIAMLMALWPVMFPIRRLIPVLIATALMGLFLYATRLPLGLAIGGGAIVYLTGLFMLGGVNKDDMNMFLTRSDSGARETNRANIFS